MSSQDIDITKVIPDASKVRRDAIHVAIIPGILYGKCKPGEDVGFRPDGTISKYAPPCGIISPFIKGDLKIGQKVWVLMYPNTVQNLRHEWDFEGLHPEVDPDDIARIRDEIREELQEENDEYDIGCRGC